MTIHRYFIPDFVEIQRQSFFNLLEKGIQEEFSKRNPITSMKKDLELFFYPEYYKLTRPSLSLQQAILKNRTYSSRLYVPVQLTDFKRKTICLKWVLMANLPLMTKRGNFLINGAARVIVNQIVRSPGVYFQEKLHEVYTNKWSDKPDLVVKRYYADLICLRGTWLRLEIDKDKLIWAQMKKGPKIPVLWLLIAMGLSERMIFSCVNFSHRLLDNFKIKKQQTSSKNKKQYAYVQYPPQAWKQLYYLMNSSKGRLPKNASEQGRRWLFKKFMNPRTYDLGKHGRLALNKKLNLTLSSFQTTLTAQDLLSITDYIIKVEKGFYPIDDIDHLKNRRVRCSGDLIQTQLALGLLRLEKIIREKLNKNTNTPHLNFILNARPINGALKEFFGSNPLSQFMDQINPLAEITHKRRLSSLGIGGVTRDTATLAIRGIHPSHYGRICPIETPEGKNTGLVNSLTTYARVNLQGLIETPFYKVYKGQVQKNIGMIYLTADQEEKTTVAAADVSVSPLGFLPIKQIPSRLGKEFTTISRNKVSYIGVSPVQMISVATSLIPFLEHDDANRALMGSNMQRQAVPLIRAERPLVGTGLEARAVSDSGHALIAKSSGYVAYASGSKIVIYTFVSE
uniref:DNA-directed RNA polymerase n=1 Tax=Bracteacoccus giganteus TaxID=50039 RepID=A0A0S2LQ80_9CHLO|nr:beta subunit of RNA polymerase [Bracteacoccus giganteus]ALO63535.1 beta subunit of RNA polymerase [Bracteacoccus giganteus]